MVGVFFFQELVEFTATEMKNLEDLLFSFHSGWITLRSSSHFTRIHLSHHDRRIVSLTFFHSSYFGMLVLQFPDVIKLFSREEPKYYQVLIVIIN